MEEEWDEMVIQCQAMYTHRRVKPSRVTFALVMGRRALGPTDAPFALVKSENVRKIKESRLSMMDEDWIISEKWSGEMRTP
jgi:hypothetical protein